MAEDMGMIFNKTELMGAYIIELQRLEDERGFFARSWCQREFTEHGLDPRLVQCNISYNHQRGTLRGMHLQLPPYVESKLVRCIRGAIYDVIVDLRTNSPTYLRWQGFELTAENHSSLYIPGGLAHGFITLADETEVFYQMSEFYAPESAAGVRWNDPQFNIHWPTEVTVISQKDQNLSYYDPARFLGIR